jgi:hypothetical protein
VAAVFEQPQYELARRFTFDANLSTQSLGRRVEHIVEIYHRMLSSPFRGAALNIWLGVTGDPELRPIIRKTLRANLAAGDGHGARFLLTSRSTKNISARCAGS